MDFVFGRITSIRNRFLVTAIFLVALVFLATMVAHSRNTEIENETTENFKARSPLLQQSRLIRDSVWRTRESLSAFLLDPYQDELQQTHRNAVNETIIRAEVLAGQTWLQKFDQQKTTETLTNNLFELQRISDEIIKIRLSAVDQYPSLYFASATLLPIYQDFLSAAELALGEIESSPLDTKNFNIYRLIVQTRTTWIQMISNFRMYLANRMGSFDQNTLLIQEKDIELIYSSLADKTKQLSLLNKKGQLDFQTSVSAQQMVDAQKKWYEGYNHVKKINSSDDWRADAKLVKTKFYPLINKIWQNLIDIDELVEKSGEDDVEKMSNLATFETSLLWFMTFAGIVLIAVIFITLDKMLLKPLDSVARALRNEAHGESSIDLPTSNLVEMQHLLDAFSEMKNQVHQRQIALEYQATHDALTGLPNRRLLSDRIDQAIRKCKRNNSKMSFLMLDMDRFKEINDTLGHQLGDRMLQALANRLVSTLRSMDTVARLGGDEFGILLDDTDRTSAGIVAGKIIKSFEKTVAIDTHLLYLGGSIGIAVYPEHGDSAEALLQHADVAMYESKHKRSGYTFYDPTIDTHNVGRLALMADLRTSIAKNALSLYYQPKIDIAKHQVIGVEALLRWIHPERGMVPPDQIIPVAEHTGLIKQLTLWVLNTAIKQAKDWALVGLDLNVAVNVSAYNLQDPEFEKEVKGRLSYYNLDPSRLTLEVTESAMMSNPAQATRILNNLDQLGVRIAIDDYGTGFSSLSYLKQLPVDELKIDKSFVLDMAKSDSESVIVRSTIELAHNLGLKVVAEGIETDKVLNELKSWQCDVGQGYFFSRPIPAVDFEKWLKTNFPAKPAAA